MLVRTMSGELSVRGGLARYLGWWGAGGALHGACWGTNSCCSLSVVLSDSCKGCGTSGVSSCLCGGEPSGECSLPIRAALQLSTLHLSTLLICCSDASENAGVPLLLRMAVIHFPSSETFILTKTTAFAGSSPLKTSSESNDSC